MSVGFTKHACRRPIQRMRPDEKEWIARSRDLIRRLKPAMPAHLFAPCKLGSRAANSRAVPPGLCGLSRTHIPKQYWRLQAGSIACRHSTSARRPRARLAAILDVPWAPVTAGPYCAAFFNAGLTLDFDQVGTAVLPAGHNCVRLPDAEFDARLTRLPMLGVVVAAASRMVRWACWSTRTVAAGSCIGANRMAASGRHRLSVRRAGVRMPASDAHGFAGSGRAGACRRGLRWARTPRNSRERLLDPRGYAATIRASVPVTVPNGGPAHKESVMLLQH